MSFLLCRGNGLSSGQALCHAVLTAAILSLIQRQKLRRPKEVPQLVEGCLIPKPDSLALHHTLKREKEKIIPSHSSIFSKSHPQREDQGWMLLQKDAEVQG